MTAAATTARLFEVELPPAPYPGLRPFERHEWPVFFGREIMTSEAIRRLLDRNLLVVHGDSGCGKSSLIRAGVLVQLEQRHARGARRWRTCAMLPREAPLRRLAESLAGLKEAEPSPDLVRQIRRALNAGHAAAARLEALLCTEPTNRICILVDQFEELFRFAREIDTDEARLFVDVLVGLFEEAERRREPGSNRLRIYAILTMRSEFLGACARFTGLANLVNGAQYLVPRMERPALLRAIREPALLYDGEVSRELAELLIADAGGGQDQLPLIQHGLMLLWRRKAEGTTFVKGLAEAAATFELAESGTAFRFQRSPKWRLGVEDYRCSGGLAALLSGHADEVMAMAAPDAERRGIVEHLFRALADINAEGQAIRRPQSFGDLMVTTGASLQTLRDVIDHFRADGVSFLSPYGDSLIEPETIIDISHEALLRCWRKIADQEDGWLRKEFQDGLIWQSLRVQAERFGNDNEETLSPAATNDRDAWLANLPSKAWSRRYGSGWESVERLMEASRAERDRSQQRDRRTRLGLIAASVVFLLLAALAGWNWWQASRVKTEAQLGDSLYRAQQARSAIEAGQPATAIALALAGLPETTGASTSRPWVAETAGALVESLANSPVENGGREVRDLSASESPLVLHVHRAGVNSVSFSPDGAQILSASDDRTLRVLDARSGAERIVVPGHQDRVLAASFSPDGARVVSGSADGTVRVWDAANGNELLALSGHANWVFAVAFAPDGARIVSGSEDGTVRVWDAANGAELLVLRGHDSAVWDVGISRDGARIVSASHDATVRVWDAASGQELLIHARQRGSCLGCGILAGWYENCGGFFAKKGESVGCR
jgi:hypothetical protein